MQMRRLTFNLAFVAVRKLLSQYSRRRLLGFSLSDSGASLSFRSKSMCSTMNPTALVLLGDGVEELESVTVIDVLRRGNVQVTVGGICGPGPIKCRSETIICPDKSIQEAAAAAPYTAIILPGGVGNAKLLSESAEVGKLLKTQETNNGFICAICAAPTALKKHNIGIGKFLTSYPAMAEEMKKGDVYQYKQDAPVVVDGKLITSRGPATAFIFALTILDHLQGPEKAKEVAAAMLYEY